MLHNTSEAPSAKVLRSSAQANPALVLLEQRSVASAFALLLQAHDYAKLSNRDIWDFAIEYAHLRECGLNVNHLRWFMCQGYLFHAIEVSSDGADHRKFGSRNSLRFSLESCFVLTDRGIAFARQLPQTPVSGAGLPSAPRPVPSTLSIYSTNGRADHFTPHWDSVRRELRLAGQLVKQYKLPSPNQEMILSAFQEEGWPVRIDDPLPPVPAANPKRRLHDTIRSLNRHQKNRNMRFIGDGRGQGVLWEFVQPSDTA